MTTLKRLTTTAAVLTATLGSFGCSALPGEIDADTKCSDYLQREGGERHDAAVRISSEIDGVSSPGNPMWGLSLDAGCGANPDRTVGDFFSNAH